MKRIYLDWGVISNLKKPEYADLREFFLAHKDRLFFVYSPAHFDDLMRSDGDPRQREDLNTLASLADDHLLAFDEKKSVKAYRANPSDYYEGRKNEVPIKLAEFGKILSSLDSLSPEGVNVGSKLMELLRRIPLPIPHEILENSLFGSLLPELPSHPSVLDVIQSAGLFVDKMQGEANFYKSYRSNIHGSGFKLEDNAGNWTDTEAIGNISDYLRSKGVNKTFMEYATMAFDKTKGVSEFEIFLSTYVLLDLLGYHSDKLSKSGSTIDSVLTDAQHAYLASYCDCFITGDRRLASKAKALYSEFGISTRVLSPVDTIAALQDEIQDYDKKYFFSFLECELEKQSPVERHEIVSEQDLGYDVYQFDHRLLGIFSRGTFFDWPNKENQRMILLEVGSGRSTSFLYFDEVALVVDILFGYLSAEPVPDYTSIKEQIVQGSKSVSVVWEIEGGKIIMKNDADSLKPMLLVVLDVE